MATISQTNRQIDRRLGALERKLKQKLQAFYTKRIKGSRAPIQTIRQKYGKEIQDLIRTNVQASWLFANDIISDRTGQQVDISVSDIQGIEKVSADMTNQFWITSEKNLRRETEFRIDSSNTIEQLPEFALPAAMLSISALMIYFAFNNSMISSGLRLRFTVRSDCIDNKICLPLNGTIYDLGQSIPQPPLHRHCHCKLIPI